MAPRSRSDIDPHTHVHVLERLVLTTAEAVDNIPIFLELLDQPVKDATLRPFNVEKWKELLHITLGLLKDQPTFSISAAWTLTRTMMICYNRDTVDRQLCLTLQHHLVNQETDDQKRTPLTALFSSCLQFWLGHISLNSLSRKIAFLEPSDAADAELFWLVNTFHRAIQSEEQLWAHDIFFVAVLTYVSTTEQSRRSKVPLTAAVIHAMHTVRSALDQGNMNSISGLYILPGTVSTSESMPVTFRQVAGIDALDLWNEDCIQLVADLLRWDWGSYWRHDTQLSLIAALYIDSTKQAHAHSTFADLLKYTRITKIWSGFSDLYDQGKLAAYWYMAVSQKPLDRDCDLRTAVFDVIVKTIIEHSTLRLPGLHILEIAVKHVHKTTPNSSDWLHRRPYGLIVNNAYNVDVTGVDCWVLFHLETILAPTRYMLPGEWKELKWSDTPEKLRIAKARLDLYEALAGADHEAANDPGPDPELLKMFLWSKDITVCTQAFRWCLELVPISQHPSTSGDGNSAGMFIPETMGYEWVKHFVHVLCEVDFRGRSVSLGLLKNHLASKWNTLPSSWCRDFASTFLFSTVHPANMHGVPAYQFFAKFIYQRPSDGEWEYLPFLATMLWLVKSSLTWARLTSLETWLANIPEMLENQDAHAQMEYILATRKQELAEESLGFFTELPMAGSWTDG